MGYYQGDFYAGARGDPGFLSFIGRGIRSVGKAIGLVPKSYASPALGAPAAAGAASSMIKAGGQAIISRVSGAIVKHPVLSAAGAAGAIGIAGTAAVEHMMGGGMVAPKGYHMSKPKGGRCPSSPHLVRNRRMNVANGRALGRAVRRLHHFARKYRKVVGFVSPRKPKGRMYFRRKTKR
jgi:hypothetical protein